MHKEEDIKTAKELSKKFVSNGKDLDFFEEIYSKSRSENMNIPWARMGANPNIVVWLDKINKKAKKALKIGCGLGDDAEELQNRGFEVTAFDISKSAIELCKERFPESCVEYLVADILNPKNEWIDNFDFIVEAYTLQSMPTDMRLKAIEKIPKLLTKNGELLIVCMAKNENEISPDLPPYPLLKDEILLFEKYGLKVMEFEDYIDESSNAKRRQFRVLFKK